MDKNKEDIVDFYINTEKKRNCFVRLIALFWLPFLIFLGVVASYFNLLSLDVEIHSVVMIGIIFIIYLYFMKHNAYYATCKFKNRQKEMYDVMSWYITNNSLTISDTTKANAPIETFFKDFTDSLRNDNFSSVAASIFPTLGILGTFISIAITMPDFSSQDSAQLEKEISLLLGGVGTAFYVSIYGIFLSLWWIYFEKTGMSEFEKKIHSIKQDVRHKFWTKEEIEQVHFQESLKSNEKLNEVFEKILSTDFAESMKETINQRLELFDGIIQSEKNALHNATSHYNQVLKNSEVVLNERGKSLESFENIAYRMQDFISQLQKSNHILIRVQDELSKKEQNLEKVLLQLDKNIVELNQTLHNISKPEDKN